MAFYADTPLMLAAGQGDREAFGILVERHHLAILRFVHRFLGSSDRDTAEDLAQDVFLAAWKAAPSFRPRAKVLTWLFRITTNVCLNYARGSRLRVTLPLDAEGTPERPGTELDRPDARAIAREQADRVRKAVAGLPGQQRTAILLRHFQGFSYAEIADVLDTSVAAVESLLFRARQTLGATLAGARSDASPQVFPEIGVESL
ncbi:MAG: RNA polymerase sigma factor [Planctomycetota bacterium]